MNAEVDHVADLKALMSAIEKEADIRLVMMLGVGFLEQHLPKLLVSYMPGFKASRHKQLMNAALRSVFARVRLGEALGMIEHELGDTLISLINIRNRFAHHPQATGVDDPEVSKELNKIDDFYFEKVELKSCDVERPLEETRLRAIMMACVMVVFQQIEKGNPIAFVKPQNATREGTK